MGRLAKRAAIQRLISAWLHALARAPIFSGRGKSPLAAIRNKAERLLDFCGGALKSALVVKHAADPILRIPPEQAVPLVLGGRTLDEIAGSHPDASPQHVWKPLVDVLFPKTKAFLATIY